MEYFKFLSQLINEGMEAAKNDYATPKDKQKLEGSIAGFDACRDKHPHELLEVYKENQEYVEKVFHAHDTDTYWWFRCYQAEVEYVLNVVSAVLVNQGHKPLLPHLPTTIGTIKATVILNR